MASAPQLLLLLLVHGSTLIRNVGFDVGRGKLKKMRGNGKGRWFYKRESLGLEQSGLGKGRVTLFALGLIALCFSQESKSEEGVSRDELASS